MKIGLPEIKIMFQQMTQHKGRANTSVVCIVLKDNAEKGLHILRSVGDIPAGLSEDNKKRLKEVFIGGTRTEKVGSALYEVALRPMKVIALVEASETAIGDMLAKVEDQEFNVFCMPGASAEEVKAIVTFIDKLNGLGMGCIAVVNDKSELNNSNIVNFVTDVEVDGEKITAANYVSRIAGIIAGVPLTQAVTHQILPEVTVPTMTKAAADDAINKGQLIITNIAGKARIARGVTSLKEKPAEDKEDPFRKIKLRQIYNFLNNSMRKVLIDEYLGIKGNSYDDKVLLCNAITTGLFAESAKQGLIREGAYMEIDVNEQKAYLRQVGYDVDVMTDDEVRKADTGSKVFLRGFCSGIDAMEDFTINMGI